MHLSIQKLIMTHTYIPNNSVQHRNDVWPCEWYNECSKLQKGSFRRKMPSQQVHWVWHNKTRKRRNRWSLFMTLKLIKAAVIFCSSSEFLWSLKSLHISEETLPRSLGRPMNSYTNFNYFVKIHCTFLHSDILKIKSPTFCTYLNVWFQIL